MFILCSCHNSEKFTLPTIEEDFMNKSEMTIDGVELNLESAGLKSIYLKDTIFIVQVWGNQHYLELYNYPSFSHITDICYKGRAQNEFVNDPLNSSAQTYYKGNDIIIPFVDFESHLREVNITKSIESGAAKIESNNDCMNLTTGRCIVLNEGPKHLFCNTFCEYNDYKPRNSTTPKYEYIVDGEVVKRIKVFPSLCKVDDPGSVGGAYSSSMRKHPRKNLIIQPMQYMDYILFFDLEAENYFAIHQSGSSTYNDNMLSLSDELHFTDATTAENCFLVLYWSGDHNLGLKARDMERPELMVFNWSGVFLGSAILGERVSDIEYDENNKRLIGKHAENDKVYCFDLKPFMESIGL